MKVSFSFDIGVTSIGSAVYSLDEKNNPQKLIDAGVRIFQLSEGASGRREKRGRRKNLHRQVKRISLLKNLLTENGLWPDESENEVIDKLLKESPYALRYQAIKYKLHSPYEIGRIILHMTKFRGASYITILNDESEQEKESEAQLEESNEDGAKNKEKKNSNSPYENLRQYLKKTNSATVGEFLYKRLQAGKKEETKNSKRIRQRQNFVKDKTVDFAIARDLVRDELNRIWDTQAKFYPCMNQELKEKVFEIFFFEHHGAPYATGNCVIYNKEKRLLKAHPLAEDKRIYESVNNIRIACGIDVRALTLEERDKIVDMLYSGRKASKKSIKDELGLSKACKIKLSSEDGIKPYAYSCTKIGNYPLLQRLTREKLTNIVEFIAEPIIESGHDKGKLYTEKEMIDLVCKRNKLTESVVKELLKGSLQQKGRTKYGLTATSKILEKLKEQVISVREATDILALEDPMFIAEEEQVRSNQGKYDKLPYYGEILKFDTLPLTPWQLERNQSLSKDERTYGMIPNPIVHSVLNQLRVVVNDMIRIYGKPSFISVELAREVGKSVDEVTEILKQNEKNKEKNDKAIEYLKSNHLKISKDNILKYNLAVEQGWKDAFEPNETITPNFAGYEIEHLIPRSLGGADSKVNRVLISKSANLSKGNMFPYEYFIAADFSKERINRILQSAENLNCIGYKKKEKIWRFASDAREKYDETKGTDDASQYLCDTRYVSKLAVRYLKSILRFDSEDNSKNRVLSVYGTDTTIARKYLNLDGLEYELQNINIPKFIKLDRPFYENDITGEIKFEDSFDIGKESLSNWKLRDKKINPEWKAKARIDHRHHAIDAISLGALRTEDIQKLHTDNDELKPNLDLLSLKFNNNAYYQGKDDFREKVLDLLLKVNVSHKPNHYQNGQLHKETGKKVVRVFENGKVLTCKNKSLIGWIKKRDELDKILIDYNYDECLEAKKLIDDYYSNLINYWDEAENQLKMELANTSDGTSTKKGKTIPFASIIHKINRMIIENGGKVPLRIPFYKVEESFKIVNGLAYTLGNNLRMDFYYDERKEVKWNCISNFEGLQKGFCVPYKPIWSLYNEDLVEIDMPDSWRSHYSINYQNPSKRVFARVQKISEDILTIKPISDSRDSKSIFIITRRKKFYVEQNIRKIELTPFGKIKKKHTIIRNVKN